jgi:hypothetical protein
MELKNMAPIWDFVQTKDRMVKYGKLLKSEAMGPTWSGLPTSFQRGTAVGALTSKRSRKVCGVCIRRQREAIEFLQSR